MPGTSSEEMSSVDKKQDWLDNGTASPDTTSMTGRSLEATPRIDDCMVPCGLDAVVAENGVWSSVAAVEAALPTPRAVLCNITNDASNC